MFCNTQGGISPINSLRGAASIYEYLVNEALKPDMPGISMLTAVFVLLQLLFF